MLSWFAFVLQEERHIGQALAYHSYCLFGFSKFPRGLGYEGHEGAGDSSKYVQVEILVFTPYLSKSMNNGDGDDVKVFNSSFISCCLVMSGYLCNHPEVHHGFILSSFVTHTCRCVKNQHGVGWM